ncbi:MAG: type I methionyl aminopeptidase [bacterium]|nr:type I methionyl aminopeptidase [bacterium]
MILKTKEEIEKIRQAGKILAQVAKTILAQVEVGVNLKSLDRLAKELITKAGGSPAFLNYRPYGADKPYAFSICTSLNEVVVHGTPKDYKLKNGDILKLDFGVDYQGYKADAAWTIGVGQISERAQKLLRVTEKALFDGIKAANIDKHLGDIGHAISDTVKQHGFSVVDGLTGHGVGKELHEDPSVFNEGKKGSGPVLKEGLVIAIEPMVSIGSPSIIQTKDEAYATADGSLSAHFEHTIALTENGTEILTLI